MFPPKEIRKKLGLRARTRVNYRVEDGLLIVEPVPTIEEVVSEAPAVEISLEEFHSARKELSKRAEV